MAKNRARTSLKYPISVYYAPAIRREEQITYKQAEAEYRRLRVIINKRLARMKGTEWENSDVYRMNAGKYVPASKAGKRLPNLLEDAALFINAKRSSVSGLKQERSQVISTLKSHGYKGINEGNIREFGNFMEEYRIRGLNNLYDSGDAAELFTEIERIDLDIDEVMSKFEEFLDHLEGLKVYPLRKNKKKISAEELLEKIIEEYY